MKENWIERNDVDVVVVDGDVVAVVRSVVVVVIVVALAGPLHVGITPEKS